MVKTPDRFPGIRTEEDELHIIDSDDETRIAVLQRQSGNFSISVLGTDAQAFYQNAKIIQVQLGGMSAGESFNVSDGGDGTILSAIANGIVKVWRTIELGAQVSDPTEVGQGRYVNGRFRFRDGNGVIDPRIAGVREFVFRPGGTQRDNVYTTWADLYTALSAVEGRRILVFDGTFGAITIPAGTYDMTDVVWEGLYRRTTSITIPEGVSLPGLRIIRGGLTIRSQTTSAPPVADLAGGDLVYIEDNVNIGVSSPGTQPFFRHSGAGGIVVILRNNSIIAAGSAAVFDVTLSGSYFFIAGLEMSTVQANTISGVAGSYYAPAVESSSANLSETHSAFAGIVFPLNYTNHDVLLNSGANTHAQLDAHLAAVGNPHLLKNGAEVNADFIQDGVGLPWYVDVSFDTAYPDDQYSIDLTPSTSNNTTFSPSYSNKAASGFRIELNSRDKTDLGEVSWQTIPYAS